MAFDADGTLYVLQHATGAVGLANPGVLVRVVPDKTYPAIGDQYKHGVRSTVIGNLQQPTSVVVGPDGELYLSIRGTTAGGGEVVRIQP